MESRFQPAAVALIDENILKKVGQKEWALLPQKTGKKQLFRKLCAFTVVAFKYLKYSSPSLIFLLHFLHSDIVVEKHNHSEIPDFFGRNINDDRRNYFGEWKLLIHVTVKTHGTLWRNFLYTAMNMSNCLLVIVLELSRKNPGWSDLLGNPGTPKITHLHLNCEVNLSRLP